MYMLSDVAFEWDPEKNTANIAKHGVDFDDAIGIFEGPVLETRDERRDYGEERIIALGEVSTVELVVVYTPRGENRRIISARRANSHERKAYRQAFPAQP